MTTSKIKIRIISAVVLLAAASCSPGSGDPPSNEMAADTVSADTIGELIARVQSTSRLYTSEYQVHKLVKFDDVRRLKGSLLGKKFDVRLPQPDRKVLIPVDAVIKGYIDFSDFSARNISIDSARVRVILPDPAIEVTSTKIDHHNIKEYVGTGRMAFSAAELASLEKQGRDAIVASIPQMGIVDDARRSAYDALLPMLTAMGYDPSRIVVEFQKEFTPADYTGRIIRISPDL